MARKLKEGAHLTPEELRDLVRDAVADDGRTHAELAGAIGRKNRISVAKAVSEDEPHLHLDVRRDLFALLFGFETSPAFRLSKRTDSASH